jgi:serine/threonine-protein kinase
MLTTSFGTCQDLVGSLTEHNLLRQSDLESLSAYARAFPHRGPEEMANYLVKQGALTRFQADTALNGEAGTLSLSVFTLVDVLGTGSMGTVYKARSAKDSNTYAIKIVPRRNVANLNEIATKVQAFKQVRHPRVSALVNLGAAGERVYLVWPYLEGGEKLDLWVRKQGKLPPRLAAQVALQVASGLQAYHEHGLFHGLLKPSDILIGADRRVRILDFGVGFLLACERGKSLLDTMTNSRALARGVDCASPESLVDPLARTPAGDQYSLGCILYFCLTGQFPFPVNNPVKKMLAHQCEEPEPVEDLAPEMPKKLADIVRILMAKAPEDRYEDTATLVKELQVLTAQADRWAPAKASPRGPSKRPDSQLDTDEANDKAEKEEGAQGRGWAGSVPWWLVGGLSGGAGLGVLAWLLTRG